MINDNRAIGKKLTSFHIKFALNHILKPKQKEKQKIKQINKRMSSVRKIKIIVWQNYLCKFMIDHVDLTAENNPNQRTQEQDIFHEIFAQDKVVLE